MARLDRESLEIGRQILGAPFTKDGWDKALKALASYTRSARAELVVFADDYSVPFNWITDLSAEAHDQFIEIGGGNPEINWRIASSKAPFEIAYEVDYDEARARLRSDIYDDYGRQYDMVHGCQAVLAQDRNRMIGLAVLRTKKDGRTSAEDRSAFASLAPHVLAAVELQESVKGQAAMMIAGTFDAMETPVFVLDGARNVKAQSETATFLLRDDRRLTVTSGRFAANSAEDDRRLQAAIQQVLIAQGDALAAISRVVVRGEGGPLSSLIVELFPLPTQEWALGFEPRILAVVRRPSLSNNAQRTSCLMELLDLTAAEADVAINVAGGMSREQIARLRGTSLDTVSTQLKSLFRKSDVNREAQLAALLNQLLR